EMEELTYRAVAEAASNHTRHLGLSRAQPRTRPPELCHQTYGPLLERPHPESASSPGRGTGQFEGTGGLRPSPQHLGQADLRMGDNGHGAAPHTVLDASLQVTLRVSPPLQRGAQHPLKAGHQPHTDGGARAQGKKKPPVGSKRLIETCPLLAAADG